MSHIIGNIHVGSVGVVAVTCCFAADGEKEEQGDAASTERVSYDPGATVGGSKETAGTNHQRRDQEQVCSYVAIASGPISDFCMQLICLS